MCECESVPSNELSELGGWSYIAAIRHENEPPSKIYSENNRCVPANGTIPVVTMMMVDGNDDGAYNGRWAGKIVFRILHNFIPFHCFSG